MANRRFTYTDPQITSTKISVDGKFLWEAFSKNTSGNCVIEKQNASKPDQTYFSLNRAVDEIIAMDISANSLFVAYDDTTAFIEKISVVNPLTSFTQLLYPSGINEAPVDIKFDGTNVWVLIPGNITGENSKLLKYDTDLILLDTVDLAKSASIVTNARSLAIEPSGDLWVLTYEAPSRYIRVFEISGGLYDFTIHETI